jgi:hypothetical protein
MDQKLSLDPSFALTSNAGERRAEVLRMEQERALERRRALNSQSAPETSPGERIRIWEKLHELSLPVKAAHPLVRVIAMETGLSVRDIGEEQRRRAVKQMPLGEGS